MIPKQIDYYSNCCGAFMSEYFENVDICPECHEHCAKLTEEELEYKP